MGCKNVVVFAAAPIPVGSMIEVEIVDLPRGPEAVRVRDLTTSIMYGGGAVFDKTADYQLLGHREDYRSPRLREPLRIHESFRGRILECVVANVNQNEGYAPCTSFCVEILPEPAGPYR